MFDLEAYKKWLRQSIESDEARAERFAERDLINEYSLWHERALAFKDCLDHIDWMTAAESGTVST